MSASTLGLPGFINSATVVADGTTSRRSSSRLADRVLENSVMPVALPEGRLKLDTSPNRTGSDPTVKTMGIDFVAPCAARADTMSPVAAITSTFASTSSLASCGKRA
jgi:hypothetical protein